MTLRFGTDGVRGIANAELTPELVLALGRAAARVLAQGPSGRPGPFLVGRDTRISGPLLQAALSAGLAGEGADVVDLGVLPTPGVAWLAAADGLPAAMISASHNPFPDNGVKFFQAGGRKLSDETEERLEAELDRLIATSGPPPAPRLTGWALGRLLPGDGVDRYTASLADSVGRRSLAGLSVVLDCAHGAASRVAPGVLRALGADVTVLNDAPDGVNINDGCGSTHPEGLQREVVARGADVGLAFDGDADRVLAVDHAGHLVDGDQIIAICAVDRKAHGRLPGDTVVVTVMANLGFRKAMAAQGIDLVETPVGDRYVLEEMERGGWALGGEQSGHIIFADLATTGDGALTGLQVLDVMARTGRPLADLAGVMVRLPQVLHNVPVATRGPRIEASEDLTLAVKAVEEELGERGRVLVRASGTEAVVRVMVEAMTVEEAEAACEVLCRAVSQALGNRPPG
ncbi:MAG TPA: phosphoglucosamine mutase [Acidimicrobiales bacterium]|nr:phosphoglucosamine mutase [Acidimicrobiales bacterium]